LLFSELLFIFIQETYIQTFSQSSGLWYYLVLELWIFALVAALVYVNARKCDYVEKNGLLSLGTDIYS
jgi:hypothetical protein